MKRLFVTTSIGAVGLASLLLVPLQGCTDVSETPASAITPGNFFHTQGEVGAALAGVYAQLRSTVGEGDYWGESEVTTDEMVVPTRGSDWYDNGTWLEEHRQLWSAGSPSTLSYLNNVWNHTYAGVARANVLLDALQHTTVPNQARIEGEARYLRAFYYYLLMDMFGGLPLATTIEVKKWPRVTRDSTFKFIESELLAVRSDLPRVTTISTGGHVTRGAVDALLANLYLNARVYTSEGAGAGINATGYNSCSGVNVATVNGTRDACQAASDAADSVINSGLYVLADTFELNFRADNNASKENIFVVKFAAADQVGFNMLWRTLHYNQIGSPTPWNGFATLAQTYQAFDPADKRRNMFLVGPQVNVETLQPAKDRAGNPLNFSTIIANVTSATEGEGARIYKWPIDPKHVQANSGNDFAWFRLAEMYLIKAEALNELSPGSAPALALLNQVRGRKDTVAAQLAGPITRDMILNERLFELNSEGKRRQDLIRHGKFTACWQFKDVATGTCPRSANLVLMPIPQTQLDANDLINQNPGY